LDFINTYGIEYDLLLHNEHPLENQPDKILRKHQKIELESFFNKRELQENILGLAKVFTLVPEFFIPVRLDFRARMYCVSEYLNYQSNELAKSLLLFSNGEKIKKTDTKAINYLKAYGANCYGNKLDKKSWNDRAK
jgi:DNA-directed RNA polymerase